MNKIDELRIICSVYKPDMLCESWLTKFHLDFEFKIQNYDSFRCDRQISRADGVIIYSRIDVDFIVSRVHIEKCDTESQTEIQSSFLCVRYKYLSQKC